MFSYLARLEIMLFFAGYALVYAIVRFVASEAPARWSFVAKLVVLLPYAYALNATLFLGFIIRKFYLGYSPGSPIGTIHQPLLIGWGTLAIFFWFPLLNKRPAFSLIHSMAFFYFLPRDIYYFLLYKQGNDSLRNDMNIITHSMLLCCSTLALVTIVFYIVRLINTEKFH